MGGGNEQFRIINTTVKNYPSQIHTQSPIGLALELQPKLNIADIESITIHTYSNAVSTPSDAPEKWAPKTRESPDHSIPFTVAAALRDGQVTPNTFTDSSITDTNIAKIIEKITLKEVLSFT